MQRLQVEKDVWRRMSPVCCLAGLWGPQLQLVLSADLAELWLWGRQEYMALPGVDTGM